MSDALIKVEGVSKKFCKNLKRSMLYGIQEIWDNLLGATPGIGELRSDEFWALDNISFQLKRGECLGLIGLNGSGKSTLLKILNGIIVPDQGRITIRGSVGALIEIGAGFHPMLTGRENIYVNGAILGFSKNEIDKNFDEIVEFAEIEEFINTPVKNYSSGMRVRLGFSIAAQMKPDILLIDEVLAVGDLGFRIKCINRIKELIQNCAVVFVSHAMPQVSNICTKVMVLKKGTVEFNDKNVAEGIDYYLSQFMFEDKRISGSGKVLIKNVQVSNGHHFSNEKEKLFVNYWDDLLIKMDLELLDLSIEQLAIRIVIWDIQLRPVADCYSQFCDFKALPKKCSNIEVTLNNLQLNMGIYSISISVVNLMTNETLTRNDNVAHFQVASIYASWASFILKGQWSQT